MATILFLVPYLPYPPDSGARLDMWGQVEFFRQQGHQLHLLACHTPSVKIQRAQDYDIAPTLDFPVTFIYRAHRWQMSAEPETANALQAVINRVQPDIIWAAYADFAPLIAAVDCRNAVVYFRVHNFELAHFFEKSSQEYGWQDGGWRLRFFRFRQFWGQKKHIARTIYHNERLMHRLARAVFYIGYRDRQMMRWLYAPAAWRTQRHWLPPQVSAQPVTPQTTGKPLQVVYLGSDLKSINNRTGADYLVEQILPAVQAALPDCVQFHIVGANSQHYIQANDHLSVHGYIDDLEAFMQTMHVSCVPVQTGWGCKLKMIESMARGLPVVGAKQAFRGIPPVDDAYFACQTPDDYVAAFRALLDIETRQRIGQNARTAYQQWHDHATQMMETIL